jgi:hypothetical protein
MDSGHRIDRRTTLKWVLAAAGAMAGALPVVYGWEEEDSPGSGTPTAKGYGTDPDLSKVYKAGDVWPLTLTGPQRETARVLCDLILPADSVSPSASEVGVVDFIDEWISAPSKNTVRIAPWCWKGWGGSTRRRLLVMGRKARRVGIARRVRRVREARGSLPYYLPRYRPSNRLRFVMTSAWSRKHSRSWLRQQSFLRAIAI